MSESETKGKCNEAKRIAAFLLAGFCLLVTLRVGMNGALFCMRRFKIPDHLYSLYVSRVHNCMELSCFFGVTIGTIYNIKYSSASDPLHKEKVSIGASWLFFLINIVLLWVFVTGGELGHLTDFYWTLSISSVIYGINLQFILALAEDCIVWYLSTLHTSGIFASVLHFLMSKMVGNRRKYNTDFIIIVTQIIISIIITGVSAGVWTSVFHSGNSNSASHNGGNGQNGQCKNESFQTHAISPMAMCMTGQGLVYVFYPAIAPGMLVSSVHVQKIDQALLLLAPVPFIAIAVLSQFSEEHSPKCKWSDGAKLAWHGTHIFGITMIICGILFFKSLHYPSSLTSRLIVNKPGMVGFLTILFYVSHMILLSVGFPGVEKNWNSTGATINGFLTTGSMIMLVFIGEGYITEFKKYQRHDWPTIGMSDKRAFSFWIDKAWGNAFKNFTLIFTRDLRKDLVSSLDTSENSWI